jgi:hypothetical protein
MNNQELIKKADMALADLASGGLLLPEQADSFIRKLLVQPTLLNQVRTVTMNSPQRNINKIGFGQRILKKATSATALSEADRSKAVTSQVNLNTSEVIAEVRLPYDVIEDNIEPGQINTAGASAVAPPVLGGLKDTIIRMIAERAALDLEELAILGDSGDADPYLAMKEGYLKLATDHVIDAGAAAVNKDMFKQGLKAMPDQYMRNLAQLRHYVSVNNEIEYRDTFASRETTGGDNQFVTQAQAPVFGFGVPLNAVSLMPGAQGLLCHPLNMIMGIQRQISIEVAKSITERVFIIVLTARVDFQIEETDAVVKYTNIG